MGVVVFALFSPKITQAYLQVQARHAAGVRYKKFSGGEDDCLGSTDSLFEA
jgi:hypothetical protein